VIATIAKSPDPFPDAKQHTMNVLSEKLNLPILTAPHTT